MIKNIVFFLAFLLGLSACGTGVDDILGKTLTIYSVDSPATKEHNSEVSVTAKAVSTGGIGDSDLEWSWEQKDGHGIRNTSQEQVGHSSTFRFTTPDEHGDIRIRVTVKGRGESDSSEFTIHVYE